MDDEKLEEQMNNYDLEDEEKELVRKGLYDVTSFGEEELEDDFIDNNMEEDIDEQPTE